MFRLHHRLHNTIFIIALAVFLITPASHSQGSNKDTTTAGTRSLFDGKTLDDWEVTDFGTQGPVHVKDGAIILGTGDGCTGIRYKKEVPKIDYEVTLDAKRVDGYDFFCGLTFPVRDEFCTLIIGGWGGTVVGLSSIDGLDASENAWSTYKKFTNNRWYHIRLRVTGENITAWIDDYKVVNLDVEDHKFSVRPEVVLSQPFGIASWKTTAALKNIYIKTLK